jgi:predicted ATPase
MPSPYRADQLSPQMRARYGMDRSNRRTLALVVVVIVIFLAAVAWATVNMGRESVQSLLLTWNVKGPDRVTAEFEVRNPTSEPAICVLRAQDSQRTDLGYATITVPPGTDYVRVPYELRTLAPAFAVELLGCQAGEAPRVSPPAFPPGVAAPQQPWRE